MKYPGRDEDRGKKVKTTITKTPKDAYDNYCIYIVDKKGRQLNTEPICMVFGKYHSWFFNWLKLKFDNDRS